MLLAPTAGGKTEAAIFPLLTAMEQQRWTGLSVIYVCPLKALLNNLLPRLQTYTGWLGRRVAVWHGDVTASARQRILREPPDLLLTTPESLEAMLISLQVEHGRLFSDLRAIVVDEVHAFAGDDRGWHLLAVLERLTRVTGRPIQRSACRRPSATLPSCWTGCRARTGMSGQQLSSRLASLPLRRAETRAPRPRPWLPTSSWTTWGRWTTPPR